MGAYDIYLNGVGYMLVKDQNGRLPSGAAREQYTDPFTRYVDTSEKWERAEFRFEDGAGRDTYDSSHRYRWGANVDSRGGSLVRGPDWCEPPADPSAGIVATDGIDRAVRSADIGSLTAYPISSAGDEGIAIRFKTGATATQVYRCFGVLVKRDPSVDYSAANPASFEVWTDNPVGPKPATILAASAQHDISLRVRASEWLPDEDAWQAGDYFWYVYQLTAEQSLAADTYYWLAIINNQAAPIIWAGGQSNGAIARYDGTNWTAQANQPLPFVKFKPRAEICSQVVDFEDMRGLPPGFGHLADNSRYLYAAVGCYVYRTSHLSTQAWSLCSTPGAYGMAASGLNYPVTDIITYKARLFVGLGMSSLFWLYDGGTSAADPSWQQVTPPGIGAPDRYASRFCVHDDILWIARGAEVTGTEDSNNNPHLGTPVVVGDGATPVTSLASHDGSLYALKPEGVFRIDYSSGYPGSGSLTANLVLDFWTDRAGRPFGVSWKSGLYFPSSGGVYEYKSGLLQNAWTLYMDDEAETWPGSDPAGPGYWAAGQPTTFGLLLSRGSRAQALGGVWSFDGSSFVPIQTHVLYYEPTGSVHLSSLGNGQGYLYWGPGFHIMRAYFPTWTKDTPLDSRANFEGHVPAIATLPRFDAGRPDIKKDWHSVQGLTRKLCATWSGPPAPKPSAPWGGQLQITYWLDGETAGHALDPMTASPVQEVEFPAGTASYYIDLMVQLVPFRDMAVYPAPPVEDTTQEVDALTLKYQTLPETVKQVQLWIDARPFTPLREGAVDTRTTRQILQALQALLDQTEPVAYVDEYGDSSTRVRVVNVTAQPAVFYLTAGVDGVEIAASAIVTLLLVDAGAHVSGGGVGTGRMTWTS